MHFNFVTYPTPSSGTYSGPITHAYFNARCVDVTTPGQTSVIPGYTIPSETVTITNQDGTTSTYNTDPVTVADGSHVVPDSVLAADPTADYTYIYYAAQAGVSQVQYGTGSDYFSDADEVYVVAGVATLKPKLTDLCAWDKVALAANGTDSCNFAPVPGSAGLPNPTNIRITMPAAMGSVVSYQETTSTFTLTSTYPGSYTIDFIDNFPYLDYSVVITAS